MALTRYTFETRLHPMEGVYTSSCILIPTIIAKKLPEKHLLRSVGTINGTPFALAVQRRVDGRCLIVVSGKLRKQANIHVGDRLEVTFGLVDDEQIDMPEELQALLDVDAEAATFWESLTTGRKRSYAYYISSAKTTDTRIKRSIDIVTRGLNGELYAQQQKNRK